MESALAAAVAADASAASVVDEHIRRRRSCSLKCGYFPFFVWPTILNLALHASVGKWILKYKILTIAICVPGTCLCIKVVLIWKSYFYARQKENIGNCRVNVIKIWFSCSNESYLKYYEPYFCKAFAAGNFLLFYEMRDDVDVENMELNERNIPQKTIWLTHLKK